MHSIRPLILTFLLALCAGCGADAVEDAPSEPRACNGHPELCDRPFDEVVFASTHNAMSNEAEGWIGANQQFGLTRQLEDGVRAMMLDTHYNDDDPDDARYLCHGLCALGATPLLVGLGELDAFLRANPNEVLTIIFEDAISTEDTERAFVESGLIDFVYTPTGEGWPTLGEMIDSGQRLVVTAERSGGPPEWHLRAFDEMFDTPFSFQDPSEFSCEVNRGRLENDLFLINHWITKVVPRPDFAEQVNTFEVLHGRAKACMEAHDRLPNFVAVDFYAVGDLFAVVDALNGF